MRVLSVLGLSVALFACHTSSSSTPSPDGGTVSSAALDGAVVASGSARGMRGPGGERGAPRTPPPPRPMPPAPPLPALPVLAKHPAVKGQPLKADLYECGEVWSGDDYIPVECIDEDDPHAKPPAPVPAATILVSFDKLHTDAKMPNVVDHRADGTEGPVRNQGHTGMCTAFGMSGAVDHALSRWDGKLEQVSVTQLWARYHVENFTAGLPPNIGHPLAAEATWPFTDAAWRWRPCDKKPPKPGKKPDTLPCNQPVDAAALNAADEKPVAEITQAESIPKDWNLVRAKLAAGQDVAFGMKLPSPFKPVGEPGARYVPDSPMNGGGHMLVLAGYATLPNGETYYLLRNSWGAKWGDGGYAWIHQATLEARAPRFWSVDAHVAGSARPPRTRHATTCEHDNVPDSITGVCAPRCPDKSPRHDDVCAVPGQCPEGYVNLFGACMWAAPTANGTDATTGVAWSCGPGGCVYEVPKSVAACGHDTCMSSCPAPSFRLAKDSMGLTCVE